MKVTGSKVLVSMKKNPTREKLWRWTLGGRGSISLTPHYHFHPFHRHLDISRAITAESSLLYIAKATRLKSILYRKSISKWRRLLTYRNYINKTRKNEVKICRYLPVDVGSMCWVCWHNIKTKLVLVST